MKNSVYDPVLQSIIIQVIFRPTLRWLNSQIIVAEIFESKYKEWSTSSDGNVALFSPKDKCALEITTDKINFASESTNNIEGLSQVQKLIQEAMQKYDIVEIRRIGVRSKIIYKSEIKYSEIGDLIYKKFYNNAVQVLPGKVSDVKYVLDVLEKDTRSRVQLGAINEKKALAYFDSQFEQNIKLDSEDNMVLDVDVSESKNIDKNNVVERIKHIYEQNQDTLNKYIEFLIK